MQVPKIRILCSVCLLVSAVVAVCPSVKLQTFHTTCPGGTSGLTGISIPIGRLQNGQNDLIRNSWFEENPSFSEGFSQAFEGRRRGLFLYECKAGEGNCEFFNLTVTGRTRYTCTYGDCTDRSEALVYLEGPAPQMSRQLRTHQQSTVSVYISQNRSTITMTIIPSDIQTTIIVTKGSFSAVMPCKDSCSTDMTLEALSASAYIYVTIVEPDSARLTTSRWSPGIATCELLGNIICCDSHRYLCKYMFSSWWWLLLVFGLVFMAWLYIPFIALLLYTLFAIIMIPIFLLKRGIITVYKKAKRHHRTPIKSVLLSLMFVLKVMACDRASLVDGSFTSCVTVSGIKTCEMMFSAQITLPFLHSEGCLTFVDSTGAVWANMTIKYKEAKDIIATRHLYYSSNWQGLSESVHLCRSVGECTADLCETWDPTVVSSRMQNDLVASFPGISTCYRSCGCVSCGGCALCTPSCVVGRFALIPITGTKIQVESPNAILHTYEVEIDSDGHSITLDQANTVIGKLSLTILGTLTGDAAVFGTNKFIRNDTHLLYGAASDPNAPVASFIGDIQSNSPSIDTESGQSSFIFAGSIATLVQNSLQATYQFQQSGFNHLAHYPSTPFRLGPYIIDQEDGVVIGLNSNPGALVLSIETTEPIIVSRTLDYVCPEATFLNISGCYNCLEPAKAVISVKSSCSNGIVQLRSALTLTTLTLRITTAYQFYEVYFISATKDVDATLDLIGTGQTTSVRLTGTLFSDDLIDSDDNITVITNRTLFRRWFPDLVPSLANFLSSLLIIGIIAVGCIFCAIGIYVSYKFIRGRKSKVL